MIILEPPSNYPLQFQHFKFQTVACSSKHGAEQSKIDFTEWNLLAEKQKLEKQLSEARKKKLDKARKPFKGEIKSAPSSLGKRKLSEAPEPAPKKKVKKPKLSSFFKNLY